ncbi:hypothetical protein B0T20DRAFT_473364 [Sordaria brevicollis]|uniref:Uncharacterized protein n=1 Tax=Sordaria brevicollis TaxID=83679 RepID=A0AAE0NWB1_SORBR|nr:hypothetical protein B0T20DRAFT_473364 [Sordaria brevicollis]
MVEYDPMFLQQPKNEGQATKVVKTRDARQGKKQKQKRVIRISAGTAALSATHAATSLQLLRGGKTNEGLERVMGASHTFFSWPSISQLMILNGPECFHGPFLCDTSTPSTRGLTASNLMAEMRRRVVGRFTGEKKTVGERPPHKATPGQRGLSEKAMANTCGSRQRRGKRVCGSPIACLAWRQACFVDEECDCVRSREEGS